MTLNIHTLDSAKVQAFLPKYRDLCPVEDSFTATEQTRDPNETSCLPPGPSPRKGPDACSLPSPAWAESNFSYRKVTFPPRLFA